MTEAVALSSWRGMKAWLQFKLITLGWGRVLLVPLPCEAGGGGGVVLFCEGAGAGVDGTVGGGTGAVGGG